MLKLSARVLQPLHNFQLIGLENFQVGNFPPLLDSPDFFPIMGYQLFKKKNDFMSYKGIQ